MSTHLNDFCDWLKELNLSFRHPLQVCPAGVGGSNRTFTLVLSTVPQLLWIQYDVHERPENGLWARVQLFLSKGGIPVPKLWGHWPEKGWLLVEYLPSPDLFEKSKKLKSDHTADWVRLYRPVVQSLRKLHDYTRLFSASRRFCEAFDQAYYRWESDYFQTYALRGLMKVGRLPRGLKKEFDELSLRAARLKGRVLIHRDCQSMNVRFRGNKVVWIDFQGMRRGHPAYDLASLLFDPYVSMPAAAVDKLISLYSRGGFESGLRKALPVMATQRLMQALGAYGFLSLKRGKKEYLNYVKPACRSLAEMIPQEYPVLRKVIETRAF